MSSTSCFTSRIGFKPYLDKIAKAEDMISHFKPNINVGMSGFTGVGYPKMVPIALADHVEKNGLQGKLKMNLFVGASLGLETEDRWATLDMINRRTPHQVGKNIQKGINEGRIAFQDRHLSNFVQELMYGFLNTDRKGTDKQIDVMIVEATEITPEGYIIPGASVGASPELLETAEKIIIELNTTLPSMRGLHDITPFEYQPNRTPCPITHPAQRIGTPYIKIDPSRVVGVVESNRPDATGKNSLADKDSEAIASHLIEFFRHEVKMGRMSNSLLPLQSGIGNVANAVVEGLHKSEFQDITVWTEVLQDSFIPFIEDGKCVAATATSVRFTPDGFKKFYDNYDLFSSKIILRNQLLSNSAEVSRRLGLIAMNTPVEFDIYGHANSTCVSGSRMLNGLGGSGDFLRNAKYSIMHAPSVRPSKKDPLGITTVVPFASHVDHTEHDLDILVTEQGLADLRGMCPRQRAVEIIDKCAHPAYKDILHEYVRMSNSAAAKKKSLHEPHMLAKAFKMYTNLEEEGTMRITSWE